MLEATDLECDKGDHARYRDQVAVHRSEQRSRASLEERGDDLPALLHPLLGIGELVRTTCHEHTKPHAMHASGSSQARRWSGSAVAGVVSMLRARTIASDGGRARAESARLRAKPSCLDPHGKVLT